MYLFKFLLPLEPCAPRNLSVNYNVSVAKVMWHAARGASSYSVQAVTSQGLTATCNTSRTDCFVNGLQCGQIYNVTVTAHNRACNNTVVSELYRLLTGSSQNWGKECKAEGVTVLPLRCTFPLIQSPAPQLLFKPVWTASNSLPQFLGNKVTWLWVMLLFTKTKMATVFPVLPERQTRPATCQN